MRVVARAIKGIEDPDKLLTTLSFVRKQAALPLLKTIKQALANARSRGVSTPLMIKEIQINEGPRLKRGRAGSVGRPQPILKRTSHIRVVLETKEGESTAEKPQPTARKDANSPKPAEAVVGRLQTESK